MRQLATIAVRSTVRQEPRERVGAGAGEGGAVADPGGESCSMMAMRGCDAGKAVGQAGVCAEPSDGVIASPELVPAKNGHKRKAQQSRGRKTGLRHRLRLLATTWYEGCE